MKGITADSSTDGLAASDQAPVWVVGLGDLGGRIALNATHMNVPVLGMRRGDTAPQGVTLFRHDAARPWPQARLADALDEPPGDVVLCLPPTQRSQAGYHESYVAVAEQALTALRQLAPKAHVWLISSTSVYGQKDGSRVDETSPAEPVTDNARIIRQAETYWLDSEQPATVLRPAGIYGPGRDYLIRQARQGYVVTDPEPVYTNRIHVDDAARAVVHLIQLRRGEGRSFDIVNLADTEAASMQTVIAWMQSQMGITAETSRRLDRGSKRVDSARLGSTGFVWAYPTFRDGYADQLASGH